MASPIGSLRLATCGLVALALFGCPGDDGGPTRDTEATTGTGDSGSDTSAVDSTGADSTGEPSGPSLEPCDPRQAEPCDQGVCSGNALGGYFCRPACSSMAEPGTACGSDDVCLPSDVGEQLGCFDIRDCDFVTGEGCPSDTDTCVVVSLDPLRTACVPVGDVGRGGACDPSGMLDCEGGNACLGSDIEAGVMGLCTGWCEPASPLPADCPACAPLTDSIGTCAECTVLDDTCPEGTQCQITNELLGGVCVGVGPGGPGFPCTVLDSTNSCQEGLLCIDLGEASGGQPVCVEGCDPSDPMCSDDTQTCLDVGLFVDGAPSGQLGVCAQSDFEFCDPTLERPLCADGANCLDIGDGLGLCGAVCDPAQGDAACEGNRVCFPSDGTELNVAPFVEGNGACGLGCDTDVDCGGQTCLHLDGLAQPGLCGETCIPGGPSTCAEGSACVATPEDPGVGACVVGGTACNPMNVGDCGLAACIPLMGETLIGVCTVSCFSQDPVACGGMPGLCIGKTDPIWHEGTCVGGGEPCDPLGDDCGAEQTCNVAAGQAFGGHAYLCDDFGELPQGADCSADDNGCTQGHSCFDDVCRQWCDPALDRCTEGSCVDISLALYLPPGSLGVCQ